MNTKEILKKLVNNLKKVQAPNIEAVKRAEKFNKAAQQVSKQLKSETS